VIWTRRQLVALSGMKRRTVVKKAMLLWLCGFLAACNMTAEGVEINALTDARHPELRSSGQGGNTRVGWRAWRNIHPHQYNIVSSPHPVRYGEYSERFEAREGDCRDTDCESERGRGLRSEIHRDRGYREARINSDIWFGWSLYNETVEYRGSSYGIAPFFGQWKVNYDAPPVIVFSVGGRGPGAQYNVAAQLSDYYDSIGRNDGEVCFLWNINSERGRWVDIVMNTNFGNDGNGYLNIWINGEQRCSYQGIIVPRELGMDTNGSRFVGPLAMRGIWTGHHAVRWTERTGQPIPPLVVYYDEWRSGQSREEVDIRMIEARGGPAVD
jgi:hypothetical protein